MTLPEALMLLWWANEGKCLGFATGRVIHSRAYRATRDALGVRYLSVWRGAGDAASRRAAIERALEAA